VINKFEDIKDKASKFVYPAIIKSQIAIGGRKKAGLIKSAQNKEEAIALCKEFFKKEVGGFHVEAILIEELVSIQNEFYCSIVLDASGRNFYLIASKEGGIDIEEISSTHPEAIIKRSFSLGEGLTEDIAHDVAKKLGFEDQLLISAREIFTKLWEITKNTEATLVEINPLVLTPSGLIAVDGKMILDEDAAFRQPFTKELQEKKLTELEKQAKSAGFSFVDLDGDIGILANGAGLTMALLDVLSQLGIKPANFLDVGGGASKERVYKALELIFNLNPKCVLINIFGGITRCDVVAEALIQALNDFKNAPPLVIRLIGTNDKKGIVLLKEAGINAFQNVMEAVGKVKAILSEEELKRRKNVY
jgi:succinyl-CoA synthetase beta subunit